MGSKLSWDIFQSSFQSSADKILDVFIEYLFVRNHVKQGVSLRVLYWVVHYENKFTKLV